MSDPAPKAHPDRLPEPSAEQVGLAIEAVRQVLDGKEARLYRNKHGDFCVKYIHTSDPQKAS